MNRSQTRQAFQRALLDAGKRWRNRRALQGLFVVFAGTALAGAVAIPLMDMSQFAPATVATARVLVYLLLLVLVLIFIVVRVPRSRDRQGLLGHLESQARDRDNDATRVHETLLLTAAQMDAENADAALPQRLYERAAAACDARHEDRAGVRRAATSLLMLACILGFTLFMLGDGTLHGVKLLLAPWRDAQQGMPYRIAVEPGDTSVRERTDVVISGSTHGFLPSTLMLVHRSEGASNWTRTLMQASREPAAPAAGAAATSPLTEGGFNAELLVVSAPFEYYLEGGNVRSPLYQVQVDRLPRAERVDHVYRYPRYTGLAERLVESATDIVAVRGSTVEVRVLPYVADGSPSSATAVRGDLVLDDTTRRALVRDGEMLVASLSVDEASRYRIELLDEHAQGQAEMVPVTAEHGIKAFADGAPVVTVARPGSDTRVTTVEEIAVQVRADDDVSLHQVELVYSINGEPEEIVALKPEAKLNDASAATSVTATHTLYLEDRGLKPGDIVSYHARASDGVVLRTAVTDIQFMEVRPFDRDYRRGRSGRGGGGGGRNEENLAAQQRDLVVALFRLARDSQQLSMDEQEKRLTTLSSAQQRIRERVVAIVRRIRGRVAIQNTPGYAVMLEVMPKAAAAMARVEALLTVPDPEQALPSARDALAHLQRADAAFREVQVASQRSRSGGGGGRVGNNDLSRLFELEMDRFRNRYSQVQRAQTPQRQQQIDDTLEKLKELARRQREEIERARRRAERPRGNNSSAGAGGAAEAGGAATQQALARALDELLRRLERLSRERSSAATDAARQAMQQAARAMRTPQSASRSALQPDERQKNQQGGQQARDTRQAPSAKSDRARQSAQSSAEREVQAAREALERLRAARQALAGDHDDQVSQAVRQARTRAEALLRQQAQVDERLRSGGDNQGQSVDELKAGMQVDARQLREQLDRIASTAKLERDVRQAVRRAGAVMREEDVEGRIRFSREQLASGEDSQALESSLAEALQEVRKQLAQAADAAAQGGGSRNGELAQRDEDRQGSQAGSRTGNRGGAGAAMPGAERIRELMRELVAVRDRVRRGGHGAELAGPGGRSRNDLRELASDLTRLGGQSASGAAGPEARNFDAAGDLRRLIEGIEALAAQRPGQEAVTDEAFFVAMARVERLLKAALEGGASAVPAGRDVRMPRQYRAQIEAYYRRLSEADDAGVSLRARVE